MLKNQLSIVSQKKTLFALGAILIILLTFWARLFDWQNRAQDFYGDKARDMFISSLLADGQHLDIGHGASGLNNPPIHYPATYYYFLSFFWRIANTPFDFLLLLAIWHSLWIVVLLYIAYRIKRNYFFSLLIGAWYAFAFIWVSITFEVVGVRVASPLFLLWLLFWYWFEENNNSKFLILSGFTAATISLFHYSIIPAVLAQALVVFLFRIKKIKSSFIKTAVLLCSFILPFFILHISQIQFYGFRLVGQSWLTSGEKVILSDFFAQVTLIIDDQLKLLLLPHQPLLIVSLVILLFFSLFSILKGKFSKQLLSFVIIFLLLAATRKQYFEPYFTPGRIAIALFILISFYESQVMLRKKELKYLFTAILILYFYFSNAFLSVMTWRSREMTNIQELTSVIETSLSGNEYRIYAFDEDVLGWDTSMVALWLRFDHQKDWFKTVNYYYNFEYTTPKDITILVCTRKSGKLCNALWEQFLADNQYEGYKREIPIKIGEIDALLLCEAECSDVIEEIKSMNEKEV